MTWVPWRSRRRAIAAKVVLPLPTWEEICAVRAILREREAYKIQDGSWYTREAREETHLAESLLSKERRRYHLLNE